MNTPQVTLTTACSRSSVNLCGLSVVLMCFYSSVSWWLTLSTSGAKEERRMETEGEACPPPCPGSRRSQTPWFSAPATWSQWLAEMWTSTTPSEVSVRVGCQCDWNWFQDKDVFLSKQSNWMRDWRVNRVCVCVCASLCTPSRWHIIPSNVGFVCVCRCFHRYSNQLIAGERGTPGEGAAEVGRRGQQRRRLRPGDGHGERNWQSLGFHPICDRFYNLHKQILNVPAAGGFLAN